MYNSSRAMGLIAETGPVSNYQIKPADKGAKKIVILGGGVAGLSVAYELQMAGYECTILEASHRIGGRNLTVRHGDLVDELGNANICKFDDEPNLYFNAGPARIPGHHQRLLGYCKKFKVPLQIKANANRLAYIHETNLFGGKPVRAGEYIADARGFMSELLWKGGNQGAFDEMLTKEDVENLMGYSRFFGDLGLDGSYKGTGRSGSLNDRMLEHVKVKPTQDFTEVLKSRTGLMAALTSENYDWGEPLMEPVGGMDGVVNGFARNLDAKIILKAQVQGIHNKDDGVTITYQHKGKLHTLEADFCFNNIPAHFMPGIDNNLSPEYMAALSEFKRGNLFKIALQMKERFWENEGIYGGISFTDQAISQIWYPSHDINAEKGVILGSYSWNDDENEKFAQMSLEDRIKVAAQCGDKIHPNYSSYIESGVSVPWTRMNHMMGCGAHMEPEVQDKNFAILQKAEGRHFLIGDQISQHAGWQEGALASADNALRVFSDMRTQAA
ncbi:flavin monoamine oxidase family protein [Pseudomaricurvus hydrocarbonicus]